MSDMRAQVTVDLAGNIARRARQYSRAFESFSKRGTRALNAVKRSASLAGKGLDRMANRWTGAVVGAAGVATLKMVLGLEERMERLGIQANKSTSDMDALKKSIFEAAQMPDIRVDPGQIISAVEQIVEKTGDLDFAKNNLENLALTIQATGAHGGAIGSITAEFQKMGIVAKKDVREALDILTVQGKSGAFTLQNLAALGSRTVTAYTAMGRTGVPAIREMGAALQVIREGTGSSEQAATAFEALIRTLGDADKVKKLQSGGIQVFDPVALKAGREELRPINELMVDIVKTTGGKKTLLGEIFDAEAVRAFNSAASEFQRTGAVTRLDTFMQVQADGTTILKDSARAAKTASVELRNLFTAWQQFADSKLTGTIGLIADSLNNLSGEGAQSALKYSTYGAGALISASLAKKAYTGTRNIFRSAPGNGSDLLAGVSKGSPLPVFVTNQSGDLSGSDGKSKSKKGKSKSTVKSSASPASFLGVGAALATIAGLARTQKDAATLAVQNFHSNTGIKPVDRFHVPDLVGLAIDSAVSLFSDETKTAKEAEKITQPKGTIEVKIISDTAKVKLEKITATGMDLDVDNGPMMVGG